MRTGQSLGLRHRVEKVSDDVGHACDARVIPHPLSCSYLGGVLIEAGSDTTSAIIQSLILLLLANPEVQRKAQKEIDAVVGPDRMPTLGDIERLPYVQAIIHEVHFITYHMRIVLTF